MRPLCSLLRRLGSTLKRELQPLEFTLQRALDMPFIATSPDDEPQRERAQQSRRTRILLKTSREVNVFSYCRKSIQLFDSDPSRENPFRLLLGIIEIKSGHRQVGC